MEDALAADDYAAALAALGHALLVHHLGAVDAGHLFPGAPPVVKDAALAHEEGGQLLQRLPGEALPVPVHPVVAQAHREGVDLLCRQRTAALGMDEGQILFREVHPFLYLRPFG